jgi:hypothetical protein
MLPRITPKTTILAVQLLLLLTTAAVSAPLLAQETELQGENLLADVMATEIPRKTIQGQVAGELLKMRSAVIEGDELILREGKDGEGAVVRIALYTEPSDNLRKRQFLVEPLDQLGVPTVTLVTDEGEEEYADGYGMKLQFAKIKEGKLTGRIHLVLPDGESYLSGYFKAPYTAPATERAAIDPEPTASPAGMDESMMGDGMAEDLGGGEMADLGEFDMTGAGSMAMGGPFAMGGPIGIVVLVLVGIGWLIAAVGGIWMMVNAFKTSLLWGLAYLFIPFASLIWMIKYWADAKKPFLVSLAGCAVVFLGMGVGMVLG